MGKTTKLQEWQKDLDTRFNEFELNAARAAEMSHQLAEVMEIVIETRAAVEKLLKRVDFLYEHLDMVELREETVTPAPNSVYA